MSKPRRASTRHVWRRPLADGAMPGRRIGDDGIGLATGRRVLVSRHRSSVGLRWPSKRIAALHRLPIQLGMGKRCALRCAPMAARSLRHLIRDATLACGPDGRCVHRSAAARPCAMNCQSLSGHRVAAPPAAQVER
ncbi:hypothetical protein [Verminephrobacter eiseniae]|nr:hypothetical protein [Verminephrobacter eiseniae]